MIDLDKLREYRRQNDMLEARRHARETSQRVSLETLRVDLWRWRCAMEGVLRMSKAR